MSTRSLSLVVLALVLGTLLSVRWYLEADGLEPAPRAVPLLSRDAAPGRAIYRSGPVPAMPAEVRGRESSAPAEATCRWPSVKPLGPDLTERNQGAPPVPEAATASSFQSGAGAGPL